MADGDEELACCAVENELDRASSEYKALSGLLEK